MPRTRTKRLPLAIAQTDGWNRLLELRVSVPGQPVPKARPRWAPRGNTYTPARTREAEERIALFFRLAYPTVSPTTAHIGLMVECYLKGGRQGDWDNYGKLVSDALNTRAFVDDKQIRVAQVYLRDVEVNPRTEITIYRIVPLAADDAA